MQLPKLILSVKTKNWRANDDGAEAADAEFQMVRKSVLERDDMTCKLCGFKASKWMEVHHINDDHADNRRDNLLTVCSYCHMCQHIGLAGSQGEAVLAWLPEIPQARLHHIVRTIQVAQRWAETSTTQPGLRNAPLLKAASQIAEGAERLMARLREGQLLAEQKLGTSDLAELGTIMGQMPDDLYARRGEFLTGFRMLPLGVRKQGADNVMERIVDSWMEPGGPYVSMRPTTWLGLLKAALK